jgi:uncharacterized coiled-coil DUF342 family protein
MDLGRDQWTMTELVDRLAAVEEERDALAARVRDLVAQAEVDRQAIEMWQAASEEAEARAAREAMWAR